MPGNPTDHWTNALLPELFFKKHKQQMERQAEKIIADYFLQDVQQAMADEISFVQQKLLNLACCVANQAQLLLLDEPVAGISPHYREQITLLIKQLKQQGKTLLMIEHNTDFIAATADRFLFLSDGALSEFDSFEQLQNTRKPPMPTFNDTLLSVNRLSAGYGKRQVLFDVSFTVKRGEIVLLIGGNGSGKSTLLKAFTA